MDFSTPLKNARHETFVLGLLEGKSDTKAYEDAGYKTDRHHAARLATKGHIQGRPDEDAGYKTDILARAFERLTGLTEA